IRALAIRNDVKGILDIGFCREIGRRFGDAKALRTQHVLRDRFFARVIDAAEALAGEGGRSLCQERGLADARITPDEKCGTSDEAPACHTVEFADTGADARRILDFARQGGERDGATSASFPVGLRTAADTAGGAFLDERIPLAAAFALSGPARVNGATILADELSAGARHQNLLLTYSR